MSITPTGMTWYSELLTVCKCRTLCQSTRRVCSSTKVRYAGLFLLLSAAGTADARTDTKDNNSFLAVSARNSDNAFTEYGEKDFVLNRELGDIEHYGLALHWQLESGVFIEVATERGKGTLDWKGYDQVYQYAEFQTEYLFTEQSMHLGRNFGSHSAYIGVGSRYRERNIIDGGLYEELNWRYGAFGMRKRFNLGQSWQLNFSGQLAVAWDSQLRVEFANRYDPVDIKPGQLATGEGAVELLFKITPKFSVSAGPVYEFTLITKGDQYALRKNGIERGLSHQPKTEYETISWQIKLNKHF